MMDGKNKSNRDRARTYFHSQLNFVCEFSNGNETTSTRSLSLPLTQIKSLSSPNYDIEKVFIGEFTTHTPAFKVDEVVKKPIAKR